MSDVANKMTEAILNNKVRVVVTRLGVVSSEKGVLITVPLMVARPGHVIHSTGVVVERMAWPDEYNKNLLDEVWV